jgi:hypothetical protein
LFSGKGHTFQAKFKKSPERVTNLGGRQLGSGWGRWCDILTPMEDLVFLKYPRTEHIEGSCLSGDDDASQRVPWGRLVGQPLVVEEKLDGSNSGLRFGPGRTLLLQSRGHYLVGGPRERHFEQLKAWAGCHTQVLWSILGDRYVLFGEWLAAKHTVFYDDLPHLFFEFDIYDTKENIFLDTASRHAMLQGSPVVSVPVLHVGALGGGLSELTSLIRHSLYKGPLWRQHLIDAATTMGQDPARVLAESDDTDLSEGLYVKVEESGVVTGRYKWVRRGFLQTIIDGSGSAGVHWLDRPHIANQLSDGVDMYADTPTAAMTTLRTGQVL